ncbi:hypothetical protein BP6252_06344 [Coleophoma cylindrospora]|uniref:ATP-grasp domain-containing protein n=1 Tax=Coleophoma cylindrospora TaxID=1849047 RepID=A0A3D8RM90_9HELO|nr:hypothetical protein BP6252_06344 [Coleophoma cylindrospora]
MPLSKSSPLYLHILQNTALLCISFIFTPVCIFLTGLFLLISPLTKTHQQAIQAQNQNPAPACSQRRILVTGVGMSKGLFLARCFYLAGHRVIGADFEPDGVYVPGRFSRALQSYHRLVQPASPSSAAQDSSNGFAKAYANQILELVRRERIELWVSCSGVATAVEDGEAAEVVGRETGCKVVQFGAGWTAVLHDKYSFIENTARVGLTVPDTKLVTSIAEAVEYLHPARREHEEEHEKDQARERGGRRYILKPAGMEDSSRADMTLLPLPASTQTTQHLKTINPSPSRPFVLQQFLTGQEFCTHALILNGEVRAFVACPSADILMHYQALPARCRLSRALELYTTRYITSIGDRISGHFSLDFMVDENREGTAKPVPHRVQPPSTHSSAALRQPDARPSGDLSLPPQARGSPAQPHGKASGLESPPRHAPQPQDLLARPRRSHLSLPAAAPLYSPTAIRARGHDATPGLWHACAVVERRDVGDLGCGAVVLALCRVLAGEVWVGVAGGGKELVDGPGEGGRAVVESV